jgi:hypothetical protein
MIVPDLHHTVAISVDPKIIVDLDPSTMRVSVLQKGLPIWILLSMPVSVDYSHRYLHPDNLQTVLRSPDGY